MDKKLLSGLSEEQLAKARKCKSNEELLALAKEEGVELNEEQLEGINGGCGEEQQGTRCPKCGGIAELHQEEGVPVPYYRCKVCQYKWNADNRRLDR